MGSNRIGPAPDYTERKYFGRRRDKDLIWGAVFFLAMLVAGVIVLIDHGVFSG
jgi:hypothetical protein